MIKRLCDSCFQFYWSPYINYYWSLKHTHTHAYHIRTLTSTSININLRWTWVTTLFPLPHAEETRTCILPSRARQLVCCEFKAISWAAASGSYSWALGAQNQALPEDLSPPLKFHLGDGIIRHRKWKLIMNPFLLSPSSVVVWHRLWGAGWGLLYLVWSLLFFSTPQPFKCFINQKQAMHFWQFVVPQKLITMREPFHPWKKLKWNGPPWRSH